MKNGTHPAHDRIAQTVKGWFHLPFRAMGYVAEPRHWGTYWNDAQIYTSGFPVDEIGPFLADLREYYADRSVSINLYVDDRGADMELGPVLCQAGWRVDEPELYLAHVGPVAPPSEIPGLEFWPVYESNLCQFATTRLRAFSESDDMPDLSRVKDEIAWRGRELSGTGRGMLARMHGQPAGIIWWQEEILDIWVNQIGTRAPFRGQGITGELLRQCTEDAYYRGYKSVLLNVAGDNLVALSLYHRLGFCDQVYWCRRYVLDRQKEE
jgi:GNAT superfamily N-acetyltransferase